MISNAKGSPESAAPVGANKAQDLMERLGEFGKNCEATWRRLAVGLATEALGCLQQVSSHWSAHPPGWPVRCFDGFRGRRVSGGVHRQGRQRRDWNDRTRRLPAARVNGSLSVSGPRQVRRRCRPCGIGGVAPGGRGAVASNSVFVNQPKPGPGYEVVRVLPGGNIGLLPPDQRLLRNQLPKAVHRHAGGVRGDNECKRLAAAKPKRSGSVFDREEHADQGHRRRHLWLHISSVLVLRRRIDLRLVRREGFPSP